MLPQNRIEAHYEYFEVWLTIYIFIDPVRLVVIKMDKNYSEGKCLVTKSQSSFNMCNEYATTYRFSFIGILGTMSETLKFLSKLCISVIPVCFTSGSNSKDSITVRENIVFEFSRIKVYILAFCQKELNKRNLTWSFYSYYCV